MAENLLELIFPVGKTLDQLKELSSNQYSPVPSTLIIGQLEEMKTALLMQAAVSEGTTGGQVLFIAPSKLNHLPPSVHGMAQPSSQSMNNIRFLYACHTADLQGYLASVHLTPSRDLPTLIIIDNLQKYVKDDMLGEIASMMVTTHRLFSLAQEAAEYCHTALTKDNINTGNGYSCRLLLSWTSLPGDLFRQAEVELTIKDLCSSVWTISQIYSETSPHILRKYRLMQTFPSASCIISFSSRVTSPTSRDIVMHDAVLETEKDNEEV